MAFNSISFIYLFLPISLLIYKLCNIKYQHVLLLILSYIFYAWGDFAHLIYLVLLTVFNYYAVKYMLSKRENIRKSIFIFLIIINVFLLIYYKYLNFGISLFSSLTSINVNIQTIIAPLGLSFFTFSIISYITDIYMGKARFGSVYETAVYISFFPKLISGPIMQYKNFEGQICKNEMNLDSVVSGIEKFIIGLSKKVIIADILGLSVDSIFTLSAANGIDSPTAWIGSICYTMQIYYDFSGYSDMAIGIAKMFNIQINENFNFPYISKSITEFWRRWHISLGTWFREYVYIPLGGNRKRHLLNLFIVFLLTGLWHGASWSFILWGVGYGILMIIEKFLFKYEFYNKIPGFIKCFVTFNIVNMGWILFRMNSVTSTLHYLQSMFSIHTSSTLSYTYEYFFTPRLLITLMIAFVGAFVFHLDIFQNCWNKKLNTKKGYFIKIMLLIMLFIVSIIYIVNSTYNPFIYFQF